MTHTFKSPKFYKELRKRNKSDQVISCGIRRRPSSGRAPGPGPKLQAPSLRQAIQETVPWNEVVEAQASSSIEPQASGSKLQAPSTLEQASGRKHQAP